MDPRLAILLGASALLAVAFGYFVASLRRARRTGKDSAATILPPPLELPEDDAEASTATLVVATEPVSDASRDDLPDDEIDAAVAEPVWTPEPEPAAAPETLPVVAEYRMVAPVELSFADGVQRVGIRPGTATFLKYQRLAAVLLNDLKRSRRG